MPGASVEGAFVTVGAGADWVGVDEDPGAGSVLPLPGLSLGLAGSDWVGGLSSLGPTGGPAGERPAGGAGAFCPSLFCRHSFHFVLQNVPGGHDLVVVVGGVRGVVGGFGCLM